MLVAPSTSVGMHMPDLASGPNAEELEEEAQPGGIQSELGWRDAQYVNSNSLLAWRS